MVIFITSVRRGRLGSSQTRDKVQFKLPFPVLKLATAAAGAVKIQCAIWSRFWCLGGSRGLTKWVRLPHLQIGLRKQNTSVEICSPFSCRYLEEYQNFLQVVILFSGQGCPTLEAIVWRARRVMGGSSRLHGLLGFVIEQLRKHRQKNSYERDVCAHCGVAQIQYNFCAAHTNMGCVNIVLGATARARSMTAKVLRL